MNRLLLALPLAMLAGCMNPAPISSNPAQTAINDIANVVPASQKADLQSQMVNAEWNLDQAIAIGALPAGDPADACMHSVLTQLGIEPGTPASTTPTSFVPRTTGLLDSGAALYVQVQQAKQLAGGGITVPVGCQAVVGMFVIDAVKAGVKVGGGALLLAM